jgi:hypothetical protein
VIEDGVSGFIVPGEEQAVQAVARLNTLDRRNVRARFDQRFTSRRMAQDYLRHYEMLCGKEDSLNHRRSVDSAAHLEQTTFIS